MLANYSICHKVDSVILGVLPRLLKDLHAVKILTEDLALPDDPEDLEAIYRGLCVRPGTADARRRRIDFLCVPWKSRGGALIYYTVRLSCQSPLNETSPFSLRGMIL
jgi:hypothetical protein